MSTTHYYRYKFCRTVELDRQTSGVIKYRDFVTSQIITDWEFRGFTEDELPNEPNRICNLLIERLPGWKYVSHWKITKKEFDERKHFDVWEPS